jgi:hypothetical protein
MHRAGVDGAFCDRLRLAFAEISLRVVDEFRAAAGRAEIVGMTTVLRTVLGRVRIDRHATDGIDDAPRGIAVMVVMLRRH